jgi:GDP-L-fucose synthase
MTVNKNSKIFIAGHNGMVGSAILRYFKDKNYKNLITVNKKKLNFLDKKKTENFIKRIRPDFLIIAAAKVGGIYANQRYKAEFIYENLMIQTNLIHSAYKAGVKKLIFLGSSCIYPKFSKQPIKEEYLMTDKLEPTNEAYAIAKIAGLKMCEAYNKQYKLNYICLMPTNLYGPNDNYDLMSSHFIPAIIKKIIIAKKKGSKNLIIWGSGRPKREVMYVDDLAYACEFFLKKKIKHSVINIGTGEEKTIDDYTKIIQKKLKTSLKIKYDKSKPDGTPRKILNTSLAKKYGWKSKIKFTRGLDLTLKSFLKDNNY